MKIIISVLIVFCSLTAQSQSSENYLIMMTGERIEAYGLISIDGVYVRYDDVNKKSKAEKMKEVKYMKVGDHQFLNLPITPNMDRLLEVFAVNDKYMFAGYWQGIYYLYIFNFSHHPVVDKTNLPTIKKWQYKILDEKIKPYFGACDELMTALNKNIEKGSAMVEDLSLINCASGDVQLK